LPLLQGFIDAIVGGGGLFKLRIILLPPTLPVATVIGTLKFRFQWNIFCCLSVSKEGNYELKLLFIMMILALPSAFFRFYFTDLYEQ
jgi:uncharacterized membrane protein YfcA